VVPSGTAVYAGGDFSAIGAHSRSHVAALNVTTGAATGWDPSANGIVRAVAVAGSTVFAGGDFSSIGGQTRNKIAALSASTGAAAGWNPNANDSVFALVVGPGGSLWAGGAFTGFATVPQAGIAKFAP